VGSRLLPLVLATAALAAGAAGLGGLALWLGLLTVPAAASAAFVAVSDTLEGRGRPALLQTVTSGFALLLVVVASASRQNAPTGRAASPLATWGLLLALLAYGIPFVVWVLEPLRMPQRTRPRRRLRPAEADELLSRAA
jgi:hypothetical protein